MTATMQESARFTPTDRAAVGALFLLSLAARAACIRLNSAEYTDGILQITAFQYGFTFWPPLYTVLTNALQPAVGDLELAGKWISILSSSLLVIPLYGLTLRLAGRRAALYAALFYLVNPIAGRWGIRVMSDSLFALLFFWPVVLFLRICEGRSDVGAYESGGRRNLVGAWMGLALLPPLAALTRFQGILLLPLVVIAVLVAARRRQAPMRLSVGAAAVALALPWVAVFAWLVHHSGGHQQQILERAGQSLGGALLNYWNVAESFLVLFPYFITLPVFVLSAVGCGLFFRNGRGRGVFAGCFVFFAAVIIGMQSVFSSFQSRYLLPLIPFMMVMAGVAAAQWEEKATKHTLAVRAILAAILVYSFAWTCAVLYLQREAFGDIKQAAQFCRTLPADARVFSNEFYKLHMPAVKMSYWSGRQVEPYEKHVALTAGDYVCLHSCYGGLSPFPALVLYERFAQQRDDLERRYDCGEVAVFGASIVPLLPDIMENPDTHQNPAAWFYRYTPQRFRTVILRINGPRTAP